MRSEKRQVYSQASWVNDITEFVLSDVVDRVTPKDVDDTRLGNAKTILRKKKYSAQKSCEQYSSLSEHMNFKMKLDLIQFAIDMVDCHAESFWQTHVSWMSFFKTNKLTVSSLLESFWVLNFFDLQQVNNFLLKVSSRVKDDHFSRLAIFRWLNRAYQGVAF